MSVLTVSCEDVRLPYRERSSVSNFSIDALISGDSTSTRRRSPPVSRSPLATTWTSHDGVFCGATEGSTPPPTPPGLRQLTTPARWISQVNLAAMRRLLPGYQLKSLAGKKVRFRCSVHSPRSDLYNT